LVLQMQCMRQLEYEWGMSETPRSSVVPTGLSFTGRPCRPSDESLGYSHGVPPARKMLIAAMRGFQHGYSLSHNPR